METKDYIKQALVTESRDWKPVKERSSSISLRILHASLGMTTEGAEVADIIKKHVFYGKPLDRDHLLDEMGDLAWYIAILVDELGSSFEEVFERNIAKLKQRYGDKFTEDKAINRNLKAEKDAQTQGKIGSRVSKRTSKNSESRNKASKKRAKTSRARR